MSKKKTPEKYKASFGCYTLAYSMPSSVCKDHIVLQAEKAAAIMEAIKQGCPEARIVRHEMNHKGMFTVELIVDPGLFADSLEPLE